MAKYDLTEPQINYLYIKNGGEHITPNIDIALKLKDNDSPIYQISEGVKTLLEIK